VIGATVSAKWVHPRNGAVTWRDVTVTKINGQSIQVKDEKGELRRIESSDIKWP